MPAPIKLFFLLLLSCLALRWLGLGADLVPKVPYTDSVNGVVQEPLENIECLQRGPIARRLFPPQARKSSASSCWATIGTEEKIMCPCPQTPVTID
jgi:hypothetical protein